MNKWEYKVVTKLSWHDGAVVENVLNQLGEEGWELVLTSGMVFVFKRPKYS